jgi:hypothetical protein
MIAALLLAVTMVPPPPPPIATLSGAGRPVCAPGFAILLAAGERADQYSSDNWVVNRPGLALGIRFYPGREAAPILASFRGRHRLRPVRVPALGSAQLQPVIEWPGNRQRGWAYWLPQGNGPSPDYILVASDQFNGTRADYPVLRRVLTGGARRTICPGTP